MYCQCFASSTTCGSKCRCESCRNNPSRASEIEDARRQILNRNPGAFDSNAKLVVVVGGYGPGESGPSASSLGPSLPTTVPPSIAVQAPSPPAAFHGGGYYPPSGSLRREDERRESVVAVTTSAQTPSLLPGHAPHSHYPIPHQQYPSTLPYPHSQRSPPSVTPGGAAPAAASGRTVTTTSSGTPAAASFSMTTDVPTERVPRYGYPDHNQLPLDGRKGSAAMVITRQRRSSSGHSTSEVTAGPPHHILYRYGSFGGPLPAAPGGAETSSPAHRRINRRNCKCRRSKCLKVSAATRFHPRSVGCA